MADSTLPKPVAPATAPIARTSRPLSESLLNDKWDRCISSLLIKSGLGLGFGVIFSVLLFKRRAWPAFVGLGFGAGRAVEECDNSFKSVAAQSRDGLRVLRP
ncbi:Mitochondrial inner membrane organizing system component [Venturia inaequalis]|uniref:MICOS complex subunit MIC10 n=1 Tax=Venturia inaequalis TaxID=5025 RepID=A0A8H3V4D8_VENIN|nr:Mitochondrial inner membrane organizing system component [Venturia inaequalis]KAE9980871.1 hypothetical protein EG328_012007 [Venturia inaequalis]KAE9993244.1 hypothetical protein EG327_005851 [Venturia inaequalis]RDI88273.1 hypothetical protein Vi05172_g2059 [Venturia inaequalis]